jgi:hypothetical protein
MSVMNWKRYEKVCRWLFYGTVLANAWRKPPKLSFRMAGLRAEIRNPEEVKTHQTGSVVEI